MVAGLRRSQEQAGCWGRWKGESGGDQDRRVVAATHEDILGTRVCSLVGMSSRWVLTYDII